MKSLHKNDRFSLSASKQKGMTVYGVMFAIFVIGFTLTCVLKLGPHYIENHSLNTGLESLQEAYETKDVQDISNRKILKDLGRYLQVSRVDHLLKDVKVVRVKNKVDVVANYEVRQPFMGNIVVVLVFNDEVELN